MTYIYLDGGLCFSLQRAARYAEDTMASRYQKYLNLLHSNRNEILVHKAWSNIKKICFIIHCKQIATCWAASFLVLLPSLSGIWGHHGLECNSRSCTILDDQNGHNPKNLIKGLSLILPILILTVADASILWKMRVSYYC